VGIALGVVFAVLFAGVLESLLFGIRSRDAAVFVTVPLVLAAVSLAACLIPARRATRVDPMEALRES
jgi:putative ABC transport system permease protein